MQPNAMPLSWRNSAEAAHRANPLPARMIRRSAQIEAHSNPRRPHNVIGPNGPISGTTLQIGNMAFHTFLTPGGLATGSTVNIGNMGFSNLFWPH